jgi:hypothetical protein
VKGQRFVVHGAGPFFFAPLARHVPEVDQRQCHTGFVAQFPVDREALLVECERALEVTTPEGDRQVGQGVGAAPSVSDLPEEGEALLVAGRSGTTMVRFPLSRRA